MNHRTLVMTFEGTNFAPPLNLFYDGRDFSIISGHSVWRVDGQKDLAVLDRRVIDGLVLFLQEVQVVHHVFAGIKLFIDIFKIFLYFSVVEF